MTPQIYLISNPTKPTHRRLSFKDDMTTFERGLGWVSELVAGDDAVTPPVREAMGWPCEIETADFAKDTITLKMKSGDYKVSAGHHWLSTSAKQEQRAVSEQLGEPVAFIEKSQFDLMLAKANLELVQKVDKLLNAQQPKPVELPTKAMIDAAERIDWADSDVRGSIINMWQAMYAAYGIKE